MQEVMSSSCGVVVLGMVGRYTGGGGGADRDA